MANIDKNILIAICDAKPSHTGRVGFTEVKRGLDSVIYGDSRELDRALQAHRRAALIVFKNLRDPRTGKPRKRWGWTLTNKGTKALTAARTARRATLVGMRRGGP